MTHHHQMDDSWPMSKYCQQHGPDRTHYCHFGYPQPLSANTTINNDGHVLYQGQRPGDEWVVPHCLPLLLKFHCHINFECTNSSYLFQYLLKYIHKGLPLFNPLLDFASFQYLIITGPNYMKYHLHSSDTETPIDEIKDFGKHTIFLQERVHDVWWDSTSHKKNLLSAHYLYICHLLQHINNTIDQIMLTVHFQCLTHTS